MCLSRGKGNRNIITCNIFFYKRDVNECKYIGSEMKIENAVSNLLIEQFGYRHECKIYIFHCTGGTSKYNLYTMMVYKVIIHAP